MSAPEFEDLFARRQQLRVRSAQLREQIAVRAQVARPALRLVGDLAPIAPDGGDILDGAPDADDDAVPAASGLSAEELQLLLGVDDIEPSAEGGCGS